MTAASIRGIMVAPVGVRPAGRRHPGWGWLPPDPHDCHAGGFAMSNELDLAIRSLREAAPQVTEVAVEYTFVTSAVGAFGSVSAIAIAGAFAYSAVALWRKDNPFPYGKYDILVFIFGLLAVCFGVGGFIGLFDSLPGLFSPEGKALYSLIP